MVTKTHECHHVDIVERKATVEAPYHFTDAGLPNVYLVGIRVFVCEVCNEIIKVEIPQIKGLLDAIARAVVEKTSPLTGLELRYLRKRLGIKASDFAAILDVVPEQLSRLENGHSEPRGATDRLVRIAYAFLSKDGKLKSLVKNVQQRFDKWSTSIHGDGTATKRIIAQYRSNRQWIAEAEPKAA